MHYNLSNVLIPRITLFLFFLCLSFGNNVVFGQNNPPVGGNEYLAINEDAAPTYIGDLLMNDFDPDGDPLTITTITNVVPGSFITNNNDGSITYYTAENFCGIDTIVYRVSDGQAFIRDTLFLTINCINDVPTNGNENLSMNEDGGSITTPDLLANNFDADGDPLTINGMGAPVNGSLTDNMDGTYTYTPNPNYCGLETIVYQVTDGQAITNDTLRIDVLCINDAPVGGNETLVMDEDASATNSIVLLLNDTDVEMEILTISGTSGGSNGSYTLNINNTITYTPNPNFCGLDTILYQVTDGTNTITDTLFITVNCINDTPLNGNELVFTPVNETLNNLDLLSNNFDVEGDNLSISSPSFPYTTSAGGTVTINVDNTINYTPVNGYEGIDTMIYLVCDDGIPNECVTDTILFVVSDDFDNDGIVNVFDIDDDNDGISDADEMLTALNNGDTDGDGILDQFDYDSDNDGLLDIFEAGGTDMNGDGLVDNFIDLNQNGMDDAHESNPLPLTNTDGDAQPNFQDVDDDGDGILTTTEYDKNNDGIPDDCNNDNIPNYLDANSCEVIVPEIFTPNFDGKNDKLYINGIFDYKESVLTIFNRWGSKVFEATNYQNDWDGYNQFGVELDTSELPVGTYFYTLDLKDGSDLMKGYIYLSR